MPLFAVEIRVQGTGVVMVEADSDADARQAIVADEMSAADELFNQGAAHTDVVLGGTRRIRRTENLPASVDERDWPLCLRYEHPRKNLGDLLAEESAGETEGGCRAD